MSTRPWLSAKMREAHSALKIALCPEGWLRTISTATARPQPEGAERKQATQTAGQATDTSGRSSNPDFGPPPPATGNSERTPHSGLGPRNSALARLLLALTVMFLCATDAFVLSARVARADSGGEAGLVIEHGDGSIDTYCVGFTGDSITGDQLLSRAGIGVVQFNGAVCAVGNQEGCFQPHDFASCYCDSFPPKNTYWSFFTASPGQPWVYSAAGFTAAKARDGDMQAWRWGVGGPNSAPPPPQIAFDQVCTDRAVQPATPTVVPPTAAPPPATQPPAATSASAPTPVPPTVAAPQASEQASPVATISSTLTAPTTASEPSASGHPAITNHGTSTAVPQAPATGTTSSGGSGLAGLVAFIAIAAVLAALMLFAVLWRRRRGI